MVRRRHDDSVEVLLVEDARPDDVQGVGTGAPGQPRASWRLPAGLPWRPVLATALVLAVAVAVGTRVATDRVERADAAALAAAAGVPGVAPSLERPLREVWRTSGRVVALTGGVLVELAGSTDRRQLLGRDGQTGAVLWTTDLPGVSRLTDLSCDLDLGPPAAPLLGCRVTAGDGRGALDLSAANPGPGRLVLVDLAGGAVVDDRRLSPGTVGVGAVEGDLLLAEERDAHVTVRRTDALTDEVRWSQRLPIGAVRPSRGVELDGVAGLVTALGAVAGVLDADDGRVLASAADAWAGADVGVAAAVTAGPDGFWVSGADGAGSAWFSRAGVLLHERPDGPVPLVVSDGLPGDVLLVQGRDGGAMEAVDARSGALLWSRAGPAVGTELRIGGALVVLEDRRLLALDVLTGRETWSIELAPQDDNPVGVGGAGLLTDGLRVVTYRQTPGAPPALTAHALRDGALLWTVRAPQDLSGVAAIDGQVLGVGPAVVVGLG